jgi:uncharacterized protein (DUF1330 family)
MKAIYSIVTALAGIALGSVGTQMLKAQKSPPGYFIAEVQDVTNQDQFNKYAAGVPKTVEKYGGHYIVRGGKTEPLEGEKPNRVVVIRFDSVADALKWYNSPEYSALRPIRQASSKSRNFVIEGAAQ